MRHEYLNHDLNLLVFIWRYKTEPKWCSELIEDLKIHIEEQDYVSIQKAKVGISKFLKTHSERAKKCKIETRISGHYVGGSIASESMFVIFPKWKSNVFNISESFEPGDRW